MNNKGFIASSLLYSMLAVFLVVMLSTLAILGNRKISLDKIKDNALKKIETNYSSPEDIYALYDGYYTITSNVWRDSSGNGHHASVVGSIDNSTSNYLYFDGYSKIVTNFNQEDLGQEITLTTTLEIGDWTSGHAIWGYYNHESGMIAVTNGDGLDVCMVMSDTIGEIENIDDVCIQIPKIQILKKNDVFELTVVMIGLIDNYSAGGLSVYINGELYKTTKGQGTTLTFKPYANVNFTIGNNDSSYFLGNMYNFILYKTALSATEIVENYNIDKEKYIDND